MGAEVTVTPTTATLGAIVTGPRLGRLTADQWRAIEAAFNEHAVLIFPGQHLSDEQQTAFGARFGELSIESLSFGNQRDDGTLRDADDPLMRLFRGNEGWHTDSSFQPVSAKASILSARTVPARGGETEWADMRAAFDALDVQTRERIAGLAAYHSLYHSQSAIGEGDDTTAQGLAVLHAGERSRPAAASAGYRQTTAPPLRPLIKNHPVTGRPASTSAGTRTGFPALIPRSHVACLPTSSSSHASRRGSTRTGGSRAMS